MGGLKGTLFIYTLATVLSCSGLLFPEVAGAAGCDRTAYRQDSEPDPGLMFVDAVVIRPVSFIASVAGAALWVVSLPFTLPGGNSDEAATVLVADPLCYTFGRPLGHMEKIP
jgi:hypothetical protein